jgi:16S rRNA (guanine966-N2)-methyltransferase
LRIVAGDFKGRRLRAPKGLRTRPTADRVREALFSMLGEVAGARVLDLYAGSGALGLEALSRGAASAVFVDREARAVAAIAANLSSLGLEAEVRRQDVLRFLSRGRGGFDLVFCDPPYDCGPRVAEPLAERLPVVLADNARIVTESDKRRPLVLPFPLLAERAYGDTRVAIHEAPRGA